MNTTLPIGQREDQSLEFKDGRSLDDPRAIAREVVGFLNSGLGGAVWIGIPEVDGVAGPPQCIPEAGRARELLQDRLINLVLPTPLSDEVQIHLVPLAGGGSVMRIDVRCLQEERRPFAFSHKGMLGFHYRSGHRLVPMSLEDIRRGFIASGCQALPDFSAREWLWRARSNVLERRGSAFLGMAVEGRDPEHGEGPRQEDRDWWREIIQTQGRGVTSTVRCSLLRYPLVTRELPGFLSAEFDHGSQRRTGIRAYRSGALTVELLTSSMTWSDDRMAGGGGRIQVHPYYLVGSCVSFCELAAAWLDRLALPQSVALIDVALGGVRGLPMRAHSPASYAWALPREESLRFALEDEVGLSRPLRAEMAELRQNPQRIAVLLVERLYEAFGFEVTDIPSEVDRAAGKIRLPD